MASTRRRLSAQERREDVVEAAIVEFARNGYHGTRTGDIARRAGLSQPYLYSLFPDKRALFLACHERTTARIRETLERARAEAAEGEDLEERLGRAYNQMIEARPDQLLFQFQARALAATDAEIRAAVREHFVALVDLSVELHGVPRQTALRHTAWALLHDVAVALDLPEEYRPQV